MANKTFYLDRETDPLNPALEVANKDELIKVYDNTSDMESDIANIEDDEIVSCKGNDYEGVHITDAVSNGDLNPVTSNAVYQAINNLTQYNPNYVLGEVDTGATWIDGKHIYRSVLSFSSITCIKDSWTNLVNVSSLSIGGIVSAYLYQHTSTPQRVVAPVMARVGTDGFLRVWDLASSAFTMQANMAVIEYTKTE